MKHKNQEIILFFTQAFCKKNNRINRQFLSENLFLQMMQSIMNTFFFPFLFIPHFFFHCSSYIRLLLGFKRWCLVGCMPASMPIVEQLEVKQEERSSSVKILKRKVSKSLKRQDPQDPQDHQNHQEERFSRRFYKGVKVIYTKYSKH